MAGKATVVITENLDKLEVAKLEISLLIPWTVLNEFQGDYS